MPKGHDGAQQAVVQTLRSLGLEPSGRIKTTISIVEKLKRESTRLSRLQDVAGCRIVVNYIAQQDRVAALVSDRFPKTTSIDRRQKHSHGYRAVHIVVDIDGRLVEIQIRTELQHLWVIWSETLAAALDQSIKYGGGSVEIQQLLILESEIVGLLESQERGTAAGLEALASIPMPSAANVFMDRLSGKSLPPDVLAATRFAGGVMDLIRLEQDVKERLTREILNLKSKRQNP